MEKYEISNKMEWMFMDDFVGAGGKKNSKYLSAT